MKILLDTAYYRTRQTRRPHARQVTEELRKLGFFGECVAACSITGNFCAPEIPEVLFHSSSESCRHQDGGVECAMEVFGRVLFPPSRQLPFALSEELFYFLRSPS